MIARYIQELETRGWAVVEGCVSLQAQGHLRQGCYNRAEIKIVHQIFDGLPMCVTQGLIGGVILSQVMYGGDANWNRGRSDTITSGAPAEFIPGVDLAFALGGKTCLVEVIPGSGRLSAGDPCPTDISQVVELAPGDLAIFDSRLLRRWLPEHNRWVFCFSVIRSWLMPLSDFSEALGAETQAGVPCFFDTPLSPPRDVGEWLFQTHQKRSE
jgi:hypothetical protein